MLLRKIRIVLATIAFVMITLLFLDFTGTLHGWFGFIAKIQFIPAVLALNLLVVALLVALTLLFGRIYCSVLCPLGILQDIFAKFNRKKNKYSYSAELRWLRIAFLVIFVILMFAGFASLSVLLEPYSNFGLIVQNLLQPIYVGLNNLLAMVAEHYGSYAFYSREVWIRSVPTFAISIVLLVMIFVLAFRGGRTYCNTLCPVGTILGYIAKFSRMKIVIDTEACKNCGKCAKNCKASCIDTKNHTVDYTRCVACGNCLNNCSFGALTYADKDVVAKRNKATGEKKANNAARRTFLVTAATVTVGAALAQEKKKVDGGLAAIEDKVIIKRDTDIIPAGAVSAKHFQQHCTSCQLCVAACPNDVLRPSNDILTLMQPTMSYEKGYCRPECNRCSEICPTGAITKISLADKSSTQIGHAVFVKKNCVAMTKGVDCGNCARHCPAGAITMVPSDPNDDFSPKIPAVNESKCIGCGACENLCPARPFSAIYVEGHEVHRTI